jgi:hypothetical protein
MTMSRPKYDTPARRSFATLSQRLHFLAVRLSHELASELARLNSARMGGGELSRLAPRARARAVKAALAEHHKDISRCC